MACCNYSQVVYDILSLWNSRVRLKDASCSGEPSVIKADIRLTQDIPRGGQTHDGRRILCLVLT